MNRKIDTDLEKILSLISCASDYGFDNVILFESFGKMLGDNLTEDEIEWYARSVEAMEGYDEEDYESTRETLIEFKNKYCT